MSYDVRLVQPDGTGFSLPEPHDVAGGTYALGGSTAEPWLNITYNYYTHLRDAFKDERGVRSLYGHTAAESVPVLAAALATLPDEPPDPDYWKPSVGNTRRALKGLLRLAELAIRSGHADAVWEGN